MTIATGLAPAATDERSIAEKKRLALSYLSDAWDEALAAAIDPDILANSALFLALSDLVAAYGEEAVAEFARQLPKRIEALEFSIDVTVQ